MRSVDREPPSYGSMGPPTPPEAGVSSEKRPGLPGRESLGRIILKAASYLVATRDTGLGPIALNVIGGIGGDDRTPVPEPWKYPWRCICSLEIWTQRGRSFPGTGWLAGPRTVITAAHCVYRFKQREWVKEIKVMPSREGSNERFGSCTSREFDCPEEYRDEKSRPHDYGVVVLPEDSPFGSTVGFFGFADLHSNVLLGTKVEISGYPGNRKGTQWHHARRLSEVDDASLYYEIDTSKGQSGAPAWLIEGEDAGYVVGIHNSGSDYVNHATRITDAVYRQIKAWKDQAP